MAEKAKQKRDLWIGHKLGNMTTDVKIGGKESLSDAILIQKCKSKAPVIPDEFTIPCLYAAFHEGCQPRTNLVYHNYRDSDQKLTERQKQLHGNKRFVNEGSSRPLTSKDRADVLRRYLITEIKSLTLILHCFVDENIFRDAANKP